jgi:uncharacterized protein YkwD
MSAFEINMIREINFARAYPKVYAGIVGRYMAEQAKSWGGLSKDELFATKELMTELKNMEPLSILLPLECLYKSAKKHGEDCKKRGFIDHTGSDGSQPWDRISDACDGKSGNENIVGTVNTNYRQSVIALLVDSGISSRGHRYNMLDPEWKYVACYQYNESTDEWFTLGSCIQNYAK